MSLPGFLDAAPEQALKLRIAAAIAEADDLPGALALTLEHVCNATGWLAGELWLPRNEPRNEPEMLQCCEAWHSNPPRRVSFRNAEQGCLGLGEGLPGKAWQQHQPVFEPDMAREPAFAQRPSAMAALPPGARAGAAFPVFAAGEAVAILSFFMPGEEGGNRELVSLVASVTAQLDGALQHKRLEDRLREHEAELSRINRIKDHFMAMLAHELRNPLTPILYAVELLRTPEPGDAVDVIERQARHMSRLIEDLLDVSRITQGKIAIQKVRLDLVESVGNTARIARGSLFKIGHPFTVELPEHPLWVDADPVRIEQITGNLLNNAAKYTEHGKPILLSLKQEGSVAVLRVRDHGMGIAPEMLERIFEPFVQLEESLTHCRGGLGLGLPLVRQLVELHGGTATVESAGRNQGAEFTVRLPLTEAPLSPPAASPNGDQEATAAGSSSRQRRSPVSRRRILLVEDNVDLGATLGRLFAVWGHEVEVVVSGVAAAEKAALFGPDIAFIDIGLPEMNGYDVARKLSAIPKLGGIQLIAMSGYGQDLDRERAKAAGFQDYLLKPVDPAALRERLEKR